MTHQVLEDHAKKTLFTMWEDAKKGVCCDVNIISGLDKKNFSAHRGVLSAVSEFFRTMFNSNFKEAQEKTVVLADISADILKILIDYCYIGIIDINENNVQLLLPQAQLMLFPKIVQACSDFLLTLLNPTNCLTIFQYAKLYNCDNLSKKVEKYMQENFLNIVVTEEFLHWNQEQVEEYLSNDKLSVNNEKEVFDALMRWIDYDADTRKSVLSKLSSIVRLNHIDSSLILEYVVNSKDKECHFALLDAIKQDLINSQPLPERTGSKANRLIIVYLDRISIYDPVTSIVKFEYGFKSNFYTAQIVGKKIILIGQDYVRYFDLKTENWHDLPWTQVKRINHAVAILNRDLYAIGGNNKNTVERWNKSLKEWNYVASMKYKRKGACTAVLNGKLYAIGGSTGKLCLNSVECYDPLTDKWTLCSPMLNKREFSQAVVKNGEIYVFGGYCSDSLSSIEKYNPETNTWTYVTDMKKKRWALGACLFNKKIVLFGGNDGNKWLTSIEEFDPVTNECKIISTALRACEWKVYLFPYLSTNKFT